MFRFFPILLALFLSTAVFAQPGSLDPTFGEQGSLFFNLEGKRNFAERVRLYPGDKFLVSGQMSNLNYFGFISRHLQNGALDTTFGSKGYVVDSAVINLRQLSIDSETGKIVSITGDVLHNQLFVCRRNYDGTPDTTFGEKGISVLGPGKVYPMGIYPVGGHFYVPVEKVTDSRYEVGMMRLNENGFLDPSYGQNGISVHYINERVRVYQASIMQPDGKILTILHEGYGSYNWKGNVHRILLNGELDSSFANNGTLVISMPQVENGFNELCDIALQEDGKILLAGSIRTPNPPGQDVIRGYCLRYHPDGTFDSSFAENGYEITERKAMYRSIIVQPNGKILLAGASFEPSPSWQSYFYIKRLLSDGNIDSSFAENGEIQTNVVDDETNYIRDIILTREFKILAVGGGEADPPTNICLAQYLTELSVNLEEDFPGASFHAFPNPAQSVLWVDGVENAGFEVVNSKGQLVQVQDISTVPGGYRIDVRNLSPGIYILRANTTHGQFRPLSFVVE